MDSFLKKLLYACLPPLLVASAPAAPIVTKVSAGVHHCLFLKSDTSLWAMGENTQGQLGLGFGLNFTNVPMQIMASNVTAVSAGGFHSLFIETDGSLWAMGYNGYGQLGNGGMDAMQVFPEPIIPSGVTTIAAGYLHSLFRTASGHPVVTVSLLSMGDNADGQLGDGSTTDSNSPEVIESTDFFLNEVTALAAGNAHSLFLRFDGSLWAMGNNFSGELGDSTTTNHLSPEQIVPTNANPVIAIAAGDSHSLFIKADNSLWAMGFNGNGQLGDNSIVDHHVPEQVGVNVAAIAAGGAQSLFIRTDGSLWGMGDNGSGQLGDGSTTSRSLPVTIVPSNVVAIAAGQSTSFFTKTDGSLWGMGLNDSGQLGNGTLIERHSPIRIVPPPPTHVLTNITFSGNNVVISGTNGMMGGTYYTLTSTNMALPVNQWTAVATNVLSGDGNFTIIATNAVDHAATRQFFILQLLD